MDDEGQTSPVLNDLVAQPLDLEELENIFGLRPAGGGGLTTSIVRWWRRRRKW